MIPNYDRTLSDPLEFSRPIIWQTCRWLIWFKALVRPSAAMESVYWYLIQEDLFGISSRRQWNFVLRCMFLGLYGNHSRFSRHVLLSLTSYRSVCRRISPTIFRSDEASIKPKPTELMSVSAVDVDVDVDVCFFDGQCTVESLYFIMIPLVDLLPSSSA